MALNTKYTLTFDVLETPAKVLATYVVYFKKEGYVGIITAFTDAEENGLRSKITNSNDSIIGINEKKIEIGVLTAVDVSELQTTKPKEWKIEITKTVGTTVTSDFEGWLIPTNNATDYEDGLKYVRLEATDGLNYLKNVDFVNDSSVYYDGVYSIFEILRLTLLKTGLSLKINTINNTFGVNDNKADTDEALKQRFVDIDLLRGDNEPFDSYKVLGDVVKTEKCRVYQEDGEWWIENIAEKETGFVKSRKYNADGSFVSGGTLNLGIEAVHNSNYQPLDGGGLSNTMPIKWAKVEHKLAKFKNRLMNKDFANFVDGSFANWFKSDVGLNISREGNGTSENLYGVKISGFATKTSVARSLYHSIDLAIGRTAALKAIERNITFSGKAYTRDVKSALVKLILIIETSNNGIGYFGLSDTGEWIRKTTDIGLDNVDINGYSKKAPVSWDIISKKISDVIFYSSATGKMVDWIAQVTKVSVVVHLCEGIVQIDPFPGETQSSSVIYKNINLGWVDADTNRNLKQINYKATQVDYAPNNETFEAIYGDYVDSSNLSTIKDSNGNVTSSWVSESSNTPKNFHALGVNDILDTLGRTPKVYDGTIWGLLKYRHSVKLTGVTNRGYIVSYGFNYGNTQCDVRVVEHANVLNKTVKKIGVLSDGTEIEMVLDSTPVTYSGNSTASTPSFFNFFSWIQQLLSGIKAVAPNDEVINVVWDNISTDDTHDFGAVVRRNDKLAIGDYYTDIELGNKENQTLVDVLGGKIKLGYNLLYDKSITDGDGDIVKQLGVDSDLQVDGRIEAVSGISVGSDGILVTKELGLGGKPFGQVDAQNELRFVSPVVNVTNVLGLNQITGINGLGVDVNAPFTFNQPIYVLPSANPNSPITNSQFDVALSSYDFGNIRIYGAVNAASIGANVNLYGQRTVDGVSLSDGAKILVKDQTNATENYIYIVRTGTWDRVTDLPNNSIKGVQVQVLDGGLVNKGGIFVNTNTTAITIGTTEVTFRQSYQNVTSSNFASLIANNQIFSGTNKFTNKLEVRNPESSTEAANLYYVESRIGSVNTSISELSTNVTNNYWRKINNYGIGTTTLNSLEFYVNNVKKAQLISNGILTGLKAIHINDAAFNYPFLTSLPFYYGASIKDNVHIGALTGTSKALYSLDLIRGGTTGYRSGVRFGLYNGGGEVNQFYYGIEYSTADKLSIGRYSTNFMDGASTSLDSAKTTTVDSSGNWAFGKNVAAYRVDVSGDVSVSGMFRLNGSFGADHTFLKSNGTTQEFSILTVGEIADIATYYATKQDAVLYGTFDGERGFKLFHDATKLDTAALFFANQDTGIVGIHYFGLDNNNNITQHGVHIDGDGFVYHKKLNGSRARFLTTDDALTGGGTSYSFAEPLYLNGTQVNVRVASASQNGVLTKEDWATFNAANTWSGGYVTSDIQLGADVDLLWGSVLPPSISNYGARIAWKTDTPQLNTYNFGSGVKGMVIETTYTSDGMYIGTQGDMKLKAGKYFIENKEIDMSGFATGKVLKATSATKAEWVTP
jgi:hypothetical protein